MNRSTTLLLLALITLTLPGCEVIGGLLQAGFWAGIIVIVILVALIAWVLRMLRGRRR